MEEIIFCFDKGSVLTTPTNSPYVSDQGHLRADANVTRAGVLRYYTSDDGSTYHDVLRHPDQVFDERSINTLIGLPITLSHPIEVVDGIPQSVLVTPDNWQKYGKGTVGDSVEVMNPYLRIHGLNVQSKDALEALKKGNKQLSPGYRTIKVNESGTFDGVPYTHRQYGITVDNQLGDFIRYNHLAIMDLGESGRSGDVVKFLLNDSKDTSKPVSCWYATDYDFKSEKTKVFDLGSKAKVTRQIKATLDNVDYLYTVDAAGDVTMPSAQLSQILGMLQQMTQKIAGIEQEVKADNEMEASTDPAIATAGFDSVKDLIADHQEIKGKLQALEAEKTMQTDSNQVTTDAAAITAKVKLIVDASKFITCDAGMNDRAIHEAVIKHWNKDFTIDSNTPDATVAGAYMVAIDSLKKAVSVSTAEAKEVVDAIDNNTVTDAKSDPMMMKENIKKNLKTSRNTGNLVKK
jgi:hypothetical protein